MNSGNLFRSWMGAILYIFTICELMKWMFALQKRCLLKNGLNRSLNKFLFLKIQWSIIFWATIFWLTQGTYFVVFFLMGDTVGVACKGLKTLDIDLLRICDGSHFELSPILYSIMLGIWQILFIYANFQKFQN